MSKEIRVRVKLDDVLSAAENWVDAVKRPSHITLNAIAEEEVQGVGPFTEAKYRTAPHESLGDAEATYDHPEFNRITQVLLEIAEGKRALLMWNDNMNELCRFVRRVREQALAEGRREKDLGGDIPCSDCGTTENFRWFTDNVFWNAVMNDNLVHNQRNNKKETGILCPQCFAARAQKLYDIRGWRLHPEFEWKEVAYPDKPYRTMEITDNGFVMHTDTPKIPEPINFTKYQWSSEAEKINEIITYLTARDSLK